METTMNENLKETDVKIETASEDDAKELLDIYAPYILETAITFEYTIPSVDEFRERIRNTLTKYPYIKAVHNGSIVGYAYASAFHPRAAYGWAIETSIYVKKDARKMGLGKKLYAVLESILKKQGFLNLNACIACPKIDDEYLTRNSSAIVLSVNLKNAVINLAAGTTWSGWRSTSENISPNSHRLFHSRNLKIYRYLKNYRNLRFSHNFRIYPGSFRSFSHRPKIFHIFCSTVQIADLKVFPFTWEDFSVSVIQKAII